MTGFYRDVLILCAVGLAAYGGLWAFTGVSKSTRQQKLAALKEEVKTKGGEVFETTLQGKPLAFLLLDCQLFLLDTASDQLTRTKVLSPDFYLGLDAIGLRPSAGAIPSLRSPAFYVIAGLGTLGIAFCLFLARREGIEEMLTALLVLSPSVIGIAACLWCANKFRV